MAKDYTGVVTISETASEEAANESIKELNKAKDAYFKERAKRIKSKKSY